MKTKTIIGSLVLFVVLGCENDSVGPEAPVAGFDISNVDNNEVVLTNTSTNYTFLEWDFGDGITISTNRSDEIIPFTHSYSEIGTFTIKLTVNGDSGTDSTSKQVTISTVPPKAKVIFAPTSDIGATFLTVNYTLEADKPIYTDYYLQISKTDDFVVLEDIDPFTGGIQNEAELTDVSTSRTISNLIPEQQYYCRIRINVFTPGAGDEESFSETLNVTTTALPEPTVTAETATELFEFEISSSLTVGDSYPVQFDIDITAARDADFSDVVTLERRINNNVYYKEPGTNLFIKAVATVNGKTSEKVIEFNTPENFLTSNTTFNNVGTDAIISNGSTVLTVGKTGGERIVFTLASGAIEGDKLEIAKGGAPGTSSAVYFKSDGTQASFKQSPFGAINLYVYEVTTTHVYFRIGSATDINTEMRFDDSGSDIVVKGLIAKAVIQ